MDHSRVLIVGAMLIAFGVVILVFSALADVIGIGEGDFGSRQIFGVILGAVVAVAGGALIYLEGGGPKAPRSRRRHARQ
jgi:hypothetical protein